MAESINPMTTMTTTHGTTTAGTRIRLYFLTGPAMDLFIVIVSYIFGLTTHTLDLEYAVVFKISEDHRGSISGTRYKNLWGTIHIAV